MKLILVGSEQITAGAPGALEAPRDQSAGKLALKRITHAQTPPQMFFYRSCPYLVDVFGNQNSIGLTRNPRPITGKHRLYVRLRHPPFREYTIAGHSRIENG